MSTPNLSPAQQQALADIRDQQLYVGRDPGRPDYGSGIPAATLRRLLAEGYVERGPYEAGRGRRLTLTPAGRETAAGES